MEHYRRLERMYAAAPTNLYFKPRLRIESGRAELEIDVREDFHHSAGAMHGVIYFKALDDSTFFAANSLVEDVFVLTAKMEIDFLRPVVSGTVRALGKVDSQDERRIYASAELFDGDGQVVGRGRGIFARSKIALTPEVHYR